jgi:hypothetical protein
MARRGFSCPNCHTWFEGGGNHPKCPLCGTRASPRDLLDDREHHGSLNEAPPLTETAPGYDLPPRREPAPSEYELAPDYETPRGWDEPHDHEKHHGWQEAPDYEEPSGRAEPEAYVPDYGYEETPSGAPTRTQPSGGSEGDFWGRIGPLIGVAIFAAVIIGRICEAAAG